ncbi:MAG: hypothetical protein ACF8GE_06145 [Phycisphaerales bacterium JB043]
MTSTLERRVELLARQSRRTHFFVSLLAVALLVSLGVNAWFYVVSGADDTLRAQRIEILNDESMPVVILDATSEGGIVSTHHNSGTTSALLGADSRTSDGALTLFTLHGVRTSSLGTFADRSHGLLTFDDDGAIASVLGTDALGQATLRLTGHGGDRLRLIASELGGEIWTWNDRGVKVFQLGTSPIGNGQVLASNELGTPIFKIGASMGGAGFLQTFNSVGTELVRLGSTTGGVGLVLTSHMDGSPAVQLTSTEQGEGAVSIHQASLGSATLTLVPDE